MPAFIPPCLAVATSAPPDGGQWVHEIKYDGYRVQAHVEAGAARLLTRSGLDWTDRLGSIATAVAQLDVRHAILDGEAIVAGATGIADFHALQREIGAGASRSIVLMAFDLLALDGCDLRARPLLERKARLMDVLGERPRSSPVQYSPHLAGDGAAILAGACRLGLEGIVCKRTDRPYRSGRTGDWLKVKCEMSDPFVVTGFVPQRGAAGAIGSLVLGYYADGALLYAGRVGTGFSAREAVGLREALAPAVRPGSPFAVRLSRSQTEGVAWVEPVLVVRVRYSGWSPDGILRHARYQGIRSDLTASAVGAPLSAPSRRARTLPAP